MLTDGFLLALVVSGELKAKSALIAEAFLVEVDAVVNLGVDALCKLKTQPENS